MERTPIRMVFADRGSFHDIVVHLPSASLRKYERIVDALREDPDITNEIWVDGRRLVAAYVEGNGKAG